MNEEAFRDRFHRALGEPPVPRLLRASVAAAIAEGPGRQAPRGLTLVAGLLAVLVLAGLLAPRLLARDLGRVTSPTPAPVQSAFPATGLVNPAACRLPVVVTRIAGPGTQSAPAQYLTEAGFVDTRTGQYSKDRTASVAGLPGGGSPGTDFKPPLSPYPVSYSSELRRWLPVPAPAVAPDGRSYIWVRLLPEGSTLSNFQTAELHRYHLDRGPDQVLWDYAGSIGLEAWDGAGIRVETVPPKGGVLLQWLIDPGSGTATQLPSGPLGPTELPGDGANGHNAWANLGIDDQHHSIYSVGGRSPGDQYSVFVELAPGQRVVIYRGIHGDSTGFDPKAAAGDSTGVWFGDYGRQVIWHWEQDRGLTKFDVAGLPAPLAGFASSYVYVNPAGHCF